MNKEDLLNLKVGDVLKKGNRRRIFLGIQGIFVFYTTPSSKKATIGENIQTFLKWMKKAELETKVDER